MSTISSPGRAGVIRQARALSRLTAILIAGTFLLLAWPLALSLTLGRPPAGWSNLTELVPPLVYLLGLVQLRSAFVSIAAGELFGSATRRALSRLGAAMLLGATLQVVVMPNLIFWLMERGEGGGLLRFDVAAFSVGAIGAGLLLIVRLFDAAGEMEAELDGIL